MNTKRMIPAMLLAIALVLFWQVGVQYVYKKMGWELPGQPQQSALNAPATEPTTNATTQAPSVASTSAPAPTTSTGALTINAARTPQAVSLGSDQEKDANYPLAVKISSQGAGLDSVVLNQFRQTVEGKSPYAYQQPYTSDPSTRALATRAVTINGVECRLFDADWNLESSTTSAATYSIDISDPAGPLVRVRKSYKVRTREATKTTSEGYEVAVRMSFENLSSAPVKISSQFNGTNIPPVEVYRGLDRQIVGGYDSGGQLQVDPRAVESFKPDKPPQDITRSEKNDLPMVWAGTVGVYFDAIVRPLPIEKNARTPKYIERVEARPVNSDLPDQHDVVTAFATAELKLDPRQTIELPMEVFFGPKQRSLLNNDYFKSPLIAYSQTLVLGGSCAWCTFQGLVDLLVWMLDKAHFVLRDWGLAIIALVCIVRAILHPITKKSQVNMMKMGKMGPEMEKLKKKFGDDKEGLSKAQMELYKNIGFTPVWGCLPMFLQMPIFIALFAALNSTFELRHSPFLWIGRAHLTWIGDLSQPDRLIFFPNHPLNLGFFSIDAINLLPILVAIVSFFSAKYTPKPPATTPEQEQQQKMMQWMTLLLPLIFYKMPSGLNIYYLTSTTIGIIEGKKIRDHIKQREEAEKAGRVIIDAGPAKRRRPALESEPQKPKGRLATWMAKKMQEIEQMKQDQSKRPNRR